MVSAHHVLSQLSKIKLIRFSQSNFEWSKEMLSEVNEKLNNQAHFIYISIQPTHIKKGFPSALRSEESTSQCSRYNRHQFDPWVRKIPWRRAWQPTPVFLPGESHGWGILVNYSPWGFMESDMSEATQHAHIHTHKSKI